MHSNVCCLGVPHLREGDFLPSGGMPGWAAPPNPRIGPWFRLLKTIAESHNLTPEFEVSCYYSEFNKHMLAMYFFYLFIVIISLSQNAYSESAGIHCIIGHVFIKKKLVDLV